MARRLDPAELPTGREGRVLALGLLALLILLAWLIVVQPLLSVYASREASLQSRMRYAAHMAALAAELPAARAEALAAGRQAPPPDMILSGTNDSIAAANLESLIDGLSHEAGTTLISTESLPPVQVGAYRRISLHVTARASWDKLIALLATIERSTPRMTVPNLQVQAGPLGGAEQLLDMSMTIDAFRAGGATASDAVTDADSGQ